MGYPYAIFRRGKPVAHNLLLHEAEEEAAGGIVLFQEEEHQCEIASDCQECITMLEKKQEAT